MPPDNGVHDSWSWAGNGQDLRSGIDSFVAPNLTPSPGIKATVLGCQADRGGQKPTRDEVEAERAGRVEQEVARMVAPWAHPAPGVVETEGQLMNLADQVNVKAADFTRAAPV